MKTVATLACAALLALSVTQPAAAAERHFGFSEESSVLKPGLADLQAWSTVRAGRAHYYSQLESNLRFELGLAKQLQAALFWYAYRHTEDIRIPGAALPSRLSTTQFESLTGELKYRFSDRVTDALGSALLVDGILGPQVIGFEGRLALDRQFGSWLVAGNLQGGALTALNVRSSTTGTFGATLAAGYFLSPSWALGLTARSANQFTARFDRSVLYLGPSLSFVSDRYWVLLAAEPQLTALKGASPGHRLDLQENEYLQTRLILGFPL